MWQRRTSFLPVALLWFAAIPSAVEATPLAEQVSNARADVDELAEQLASQRRATREQLSTLRAERDELKRQVRLEEIRRDTLARLRAERTRDIDDQEERILERLSPIQRSLVVAKEYVLTALPFKTEERMRRLERIEADLAVTHPDPAQALTQLWRFIEEEASMGGEIIFAQQIIQLEGERVLGDVVRIGMALMYFRLPNGDVGWARRSESGWRLEKIDAVQARATVEQLFDAFQDNQTLGPQHLLLPTELPQTMERELQ